MTNASLLSINCKSAPKGGRMGVPVLHEILLKIPKSARLANTLPNVCQEGSNQIESKKEEYNN